MPVISHRQALLLLKHARHLLRSLRNIAGSRATDPEFEELDSILTALIQHERKGADSEHARHNPPGLVIYGHNPPRGSKVLSENVHQMRYTHAEDGDDYVHDFVTDDVQALALPDGSVLLRGASGQRLWEDM